ncbi:4,5-DOPA dioxygenase extradiol [Neobacillus niacini]|uniref:dioxygenase family protein n=1 Tax=Neobacillus niacini TaxID=86668 RepID=UPI00285FE338|nr:class III extradiol ring-cleavage dioxygenase [Neobacillus niacini]MDR7078144.1 4,5-DOPA dioxygenase extradiol [Neobacillus niacini]
MVPSLFIGHGSPYLAVQQNEYSNFLSQLGKRYNPKAIVIFSAHWESEILSLTYTDDVLETVYDYYGFPEEMYQIKYPARGSTRIAKILEERFKNLGIKTKREEKRGLDHGSWVALRHMFPKADIPVIQLSVHPFLTPKAQYHIGQALQGLGDEDILVIGSGTTVHNFNWFFPEATEPVKEAVEFDNWIIEYVKKRDIDSLDQYLQLAPHARLAVPRPEHFVPLFLALGSGDENKKPLVLNQTYDFGALSNLCMEF